MKPRKLSAFFTLVSMGILVLDCRRTVTFAAQGIALCTATVIPSLFPFFVLSIYLTGNLSGRSGYLPILLSGFLGGYPVGAQVVTENWKTGRISQETANKMLMFCSQAGPSFLFGMVAARFPEGHFAWQLWGIQILSAISVALLIPIPEKPKAVRQDLPPVALTDAMQRSVRAMASVCGWVVFFRVILGYLTIFSSGTIPEVVISGFLELSNGCMKLEAVESVSLRFLLACVMLNFGGICVLLQTASVTRGLDLGHYLLGKLLQTGFAILYCLVFLGYFCAILPAVLVILLFGPRKSIKNSSIPAGIGV
jgi:hypothetical protein